MSKLVVRFIQCGMTIVKLLGDTFAIHNTKVKKVRDDFSNSVDVKQITNEKLRKNIFCRW